MSRLARLAAAAAVLGVLVWRLGTGPFANGLGAVNAQALGAAVLLAVPATVCCAWRWKVVAHRLGVDLPLPTAVAAYYRSLFLNVTLPGGVVGDLHRAVSHGRDVDDVGRAVRAVVWERVAGQVVQALLTVIVLLVLPSPVHAAMPFVAIASAAVLAGVAACARGRARLAPRAWLVIVLTSATIVCLHAATFVIAAHTAGVDVSASRLMPLALLVMTVMVLPGIGGWGPREGGAAWVFGAAGLGAAQGVATAVVYGVMVFAACLPGAVVLAVAWLRRPQRTVRTQTPGWEHAVHA